MPSLCSPAVGLRLSAAQLDGVAAMREVQRAQRLGGGVERRRGVDEHQHLREAAAAAADRSEVKEGNQMHG